MTTPALSAFSPPGAAPAPLVPQADLGRAGRASLIASLALMGLFLAWAQLTPISGAVVAPGQATVPGKPRVVQSLDGGRVERIAVANGDPVVAGQVLLQLDPRLIQAKLDVARGRLVAALALRARLEAEQAGAAAPDFPQPDLPFDLPDSSAAEAGQRQIFAARAALREGRAAQRVERVAQMANQIEGVMAQIAAGEAQLKILESELASAGELVGKGMMRKAELLDLQSRQAGLLGDIAGRRAEVARLQNAARDAELEVDQAERAFHEEVAIELRKTMTEVEEMILEVITLTDQLARVEIRAPSDGVVHEMQVTTEGGVVAPGETILQVVPQGNGVEFEMRLSTQDLDRVHVGQPTQLVFPSLDQRTTPRLEATVASVSPAAIIDPQTGQNFYRLKIAVTPAELARLGPVEILPGMPVEAFLQTGDRSVMSYLLSPLTRQAMLAFREE